MSYARGGFGNRSPQQQYTPSPRERLKMLVASQQAEISQEESILQDYNINKAKQKNVSTSSYSSGSSVHWSSSSNNNATTTTYGSPNNTYSSAPNSGYGSNTANSSSNYGTALSNSNSNDPHGVQSHSFSSNPSRTSAAPASTDAFNFGSWELPSSTLSMPPVSSSTSGNSSFYGGGSGSRFDSSSRPTNSQEPGYGSTSKTSPSHAFSGKNAAFSHGRGSSIDDSAQSTASTSIKPPTMKPKQKNLAMDDDEFFAVFGFRQSDLPSSTTKLGDFSSESRSHANNSAGGSSGFTGSLERPSPSHASLDSTPNNSVQFAATSSAQPSSYSHGVNQQSFNLQYGNNSAKDAIAVVTHLPVATRDEIRPSTVQQASPAPAAQPSAFYSHPAAITAFQNNRTDDEELSWGEPSSATPAAPVASSSSTKTVNSSAAEAISHKNSSSSDNNNVSDSSWFGIDKKPLGSVMVQCPQCRHQFTPLN